MTREELKQKVFTAIDQHADLIKDYHKKLYNHPELGFKEVFATELTAKAFTDLGLKTDTNIAITGVRAYANADKTGPKVVVMGELDAVLCPNHTDANKETGAAHACGHSAQMAHVLGCAIGLVKSGVLDELDGKVDFIGIPAEEMLEIEYRASLAKEGKLKYFGGKPEYIRKGGFDDVDMVLMTHSMEMPEGQNINVSMKSVGFLTKRIAYEGFAAHAGAAPHLGINALNAATIGLQSVHAIRETLKDEDHIRIHPIITKGGSGVNSVPDDVRIESYIRGLTLPAILDTNKKMNRALIAGALAIGAKITIEDAPGYMPFEPDPSLEEVYITAATDLLGEQAIAAGGLLSGSLDIGDVSLLKPCVHSFSGGVVEAIHSPEFKVVDEDKAFIIPAKVAAATIIDLLIDQAAQARNVMKNFKPKMSKAEYLEVMESLFHKETYDPAASLNLK